MRCGGRGLVFLEVAFWTLPVVLKTAFFACTYRKEPTFLTVFQRPMSLLKKNSNILFLSLKKQETKCIAIYLIKEKKKEKKNSLLSRGIKSSNFTIHIVDCSMYCKYMKGYYTNRPSPHMYTQSIAIQIKCPSEYFVCTLWANISFSGDSKTVFLPFPSFFSFPLKSIRKTIPNIT